MNRLSACVAAWCAAAAAFADPIDTSAFSRKIEFTVPGYTSETPIERVPICVRLDSSRVDGFDPGALAADAADLRATDSAGNELPFEIDTFDGENLILWVLLPELSQSTTFRLYYGTTTPPARTTSPSDVWSDCRGVWHLGEPGDADLCADSSPNNNPGTPQAQVSTATGLIGRAKRTATTKGASTTGGIRIPDNDALAIDGAFTVSFWYSTLSGAYDWAYPIATKATDTVPSWGMQFRSATTLNIYTAQNNSNGSGTIPLTVPTLSSGDIGAWHKIDVVYNGTTVKGYVDGTLANEATANLPVAYTGTGLSLGSLNGDGYGLFNGILDEVRITSGELSPQRIAADYAMAKQADYLANTGVEVLSETAPEFARLPALALEDGHFTLTVALSKGVASLQAIFGEIAIDLTDSEVSAPFEQTFLLDALPADFLTDCTVVAANTHGEVVRRSVGRTLYTGSLSVAAEGSPSMMDLSTGTFTISRGTATGFDLPVAYTLSGTAEAGSDYAALSGEAIIPADSTSVTVTLEPLRNLSQTENPTVTLTLSPGLYRINESAAEATLTIAKLTLPEDKVVWFGSASEDATDPANWSTGTLPSASDHILFDGRFSNANCKWYGNEKGLPAEVASLTFSEGYSGRLMVATSYEEAGLSAAFHEFKVAGDLTLSSGRISPLRVASQARQYRLKLSVGGNLTVARGASIDGCGYGRYCDFGGLRNWGNHGGNWGNYSDAPASAWTNAFGSILAPVEAGWGICNGTGSARLAYGGAAIWIEVGGHLANDGTVTVKGGQNSEASGSGGSIYVCAESITGSGTFDASGTAGTKGDGCSCAGAGGRMALVSRGANDFIAARSRTTANGTREGWNSQGGAGTIWLTSPEASVLRVYQSSIVNSSYNIATTPLPSPDHPEEAGSFKRATLDLGNRARVVLQANLRFAALSIADTYNHAAALSTLDLNGCVLTVDTAAYSSVASSALNAELEPGTYSASDIASGWLIDSSEGQTGRLVVRGAEPPTLIFIY